MPTLGKTVLGLACAASLFGASAAGADDAKPERVCFNKREVNSIRALDEGHVFAKLSAERFYMLTVDKACRGLELARQIALDATRSRICGDATTLLTFEEPTVGLMRCRIERIDAVKDMAAARDLIDTRREPEKKE